MQDIKDLSLGELEKFLTEWGQPAFHARQIFAWIYKKGATDFSCMSDLSFGLKDKLKENFYLLSLKSIKVLCSSDRTEKFLFALKDKNLIEGVVIPAEKRVTACLSTQVGCKFACCFCASGKFGFRRNLTTGEIIEQILCMQRHLKDREPTHIVFMGIGEPLDNYDNVLRAIRIINSPQGLNIGARRITISTCGIIPQIDRLANEDIQVELSVSLHAADDKTRSWFIPINKKYPLHELIKTCKNYIKKTNRQITFEYILIKGLNSDLQNAQKLSKILKDLRLCKVNLIPSNYIKELEIEPPGKLEIFLFRDYLLKHGIGVTLRRPRGEDIEAACGQLRLRYENK